MKDLDWTLNERSQFFSINSGTYEFFLRKNAFKFKYIPSKRWRGNNSRKKYDVRLRDIQILCCFFLHSY